MKVVLLAGGLGSRLSEETIARPKPLIEIGQYPILWHIMKIYSHYGLNDFIICCGYKGYLIKEFFANYILHTRDVEIDVKNNKIKIISGSKKIDNWKITLVDTGPETQTGGRLKRVKKYINNTFCLTYGDGLANINIKDLLKFHKKKKTIATMTVVNPPGRFGTALIENDIVKSFDEKPVSEKGWINGGFFVFEPDIFSFIRNDAESLEGFPLKTLSKKNQLSSFKHKKFWQPMDTLRDKKLLENLWETKAPWKIW
tara:strand:- start:1363 stop:2130 length:768 start_codon:yes stop_codon:yes gene_type:complete